MTAVEIETVDLIVKVTNVYPGEEITHFEEVELPAPDSYDEDDLEDWADEHLFPLTGTGRLSGEAGYFVTITHGDDPELVGRTWEWFG